MDFEAYAQSILNGTYKLPPPPKAKQYVVKNTVPMPKGKFALYQDTVHYFMGKHQDFNEAQGILRRSADIMFYADDRDEDDDLEPVPKYKIGSIKYCTINVGEVRENPDVDNIT